ncbi:hypothetical protein L207DRAFT_640744 [Hyaloscypha variabilis F]|uniref:Cysteine proteinase n=1 Tax=Hyaloscypha variabilis (strain UAMH 11265 / GT02V1 / F) TaxID=1149755 RepID=A0A2J6QYV9_HYAVF|nr:hypothetical protein L207DRAFT_640744 [Hyaloscypha variabilis F]
MNETANADLFTTDPSRLFIYYNAREIDPEMEDNITDDGSVNRLAMKSLKQFGVCSDGTDPFIIKEDRATRPVENINTPPTPEAYAEAKAVQVLKYCGLDPDYPDEEESNATEDERNTAGATTLQNLKQCLTEGYPVVFGFTFYWDSPPWETDTEIYYLLPSLDDDQRHKPPPKDENGKAFGGHTVLAIGYDDNTGQVLCRNSWGKEREKPGLFYMTYDWITDWEATNDFWTLRVIQSDDQ